jgi:dihydroorotate dehydrogenase electron transfer subunit
VAAPGDAPADPVPAAPGPDFTPDPARPRRLVVGIGSGIDAAVELALRLAVADGPTPLVLFEAAAPLSFPVRPSTILVPGLPDGVIAAHAALDPRGIPSRVAVPGADLPGCHDGDVASLAQGWLAAQDAAALADVEAFVLGPAERLHDVARLLAANAVPARYRAA